MRGIRTQERIVRRLFEEVINRGEVDLIDELLTSDHVNHDPVNPVRGSQGYKDLVMKYRSAFPDIRLDIDELFSAGDRVVCRYRGSGTQRGPLEGIAPTGRQVTDVTGIYIARFSGDRIQETFVNWDALGLMQQLGVVTMPGKAAEAGA